MSMVTRCKRGFQRVTGVSSVLIVVALAACDRGAVAPMNASSLWPVRHITISIDRPPAAVYELAGDPQNLPRWAKGLAGSITRVDDETWLADAPMGKVKVRFADDNTFGVLDHDVTLESGATIHNPMRVLPNAGGSEVVFALFRRPGITDAEFESDAKAVARDLRALKALLESHKS